MRIVNRDVMDLCPKCGANLWLNEELMIWQCSTTRCQWRTPAYTIPDKQPEAPDVKRCKFCDHVLEYDHHVRDDFKLWCSACNACFNEAGKAQPGQRIWYTVPDEDITITYALPEPPTIGTKRCMDVARADALEAVAAAAVGVFTRHGKELIYMPGSKSRNDLQQAVENLLSTGWRPNK